MDDLSNSMTLAQEIVASLVFLVTKIIVIEDHKLYDTFLHVVFWSQSLLRTMSDLTGSNTN
jgi:type IV secretory pathway VirB3-like protein